jgi:hypothetical protein
MISIKKMIFKSQSEKTEMVCYKKNGILFVPLLQHQDLYAFPGMKTSNKAITAKQLQEMGATPIMKQLFNSPNWKTNGYQL